MTGKMFLSAAALGLGLGILAVILMFWPLGDGGYGGSVSELSLPLAYGAIAGLLMGLICCSGAYVAIEIQAMKHWTVSAARQATAAGSGAAVAALLPAVGLVALGMSDAAPAPFLGAALGFLAVCFASGFALLTGLNRCQARC